MNQRYAIVVYCVAAVLFMRIVDYSWVTDDAFITFRSVLNFIAGSGPVYNIGERVQSFTHPLWFMLLSVGGLLGLNLYFFAILLGLAFSLLEILALIRLNKQIGNDSHFMLIIAIGVLAASESFVTFGTSGLEDSLTYLLVTLIVMASLEPSRRSIFYFLVSLALLNRLDSVFFVMPLFLWVTYSDWRIGKFRLKNAILCLSPLLIWHLFTVIYYGFLFPNTKYVKLGGRSLIENAKSGIYYLADSMQAEIHVWLLVVLLPFMLLIALRLRSSRLRIISHKPIMVAIVLGIYLQIAYVVFISGGDFMRGRFFTVVTLGASIALLFFHLDAGRYIKIGLIGVFACLFPISAWIGAKEHILWPAPGVANERNFYKKYMALNVNPYRLYYNHPWAKDARVLNSKARHGTIGLLGVNGQRGYYIDRHVELIDPVGLTDAFIARLPVENSDRTGHFTRKIPKEYLRIKLYGEKVAHWQDKNMQALYNNIAVVTESRSLFSWKRLRSMIWVWRRYGI